MVQRIIYYKKHPNGTPKELMDNPDLYRRIDILTLFDMLFCGIATEDNKREIDSFTSLSGIQIHDWDDSDPLKNLDFYAAKVKSLDLVISVDNTTAHFAGALGTRCFLMLPYNQEWRWGEDCDYSYWYPDVLSLFRQTSCKDWNHVINEVSETLRNYF